MAKTKYVIFSKDLTEFDLDTIEKIVESKLVSSVETDEHFILGRYGTNKRELRSILKAKAEEEAF